MSSCGRTATGIGTIVMAILIAGYASGPDTSIVSFEPATAIYYERREEPPQISTLDYDELVAGGLINLGSVNVTQIIEKCWEGSGKCQSRQYDVSAITALMIEAMNQGADIVVLTADRELAINIIEKRGQCLKMDQVCSAVYGTSGRRCGGDIKSGCVSNNTNTRCEQACTVYERVIGQERVETSSGLLWRKQASSDAGFQP